MDRQRLAGMTARALAAEDPGLIVWWGSIVEAWSALARLQRDELLTRDALDQSRGLLRTLSDSWTEIIASEQVRNHAQRLLLRHPLRAADALQLGAAMTWTSGQPDRHRLCTFDSRLAAAARGEGFRILP